MIVRRARAEDVPACVRLVELRRRRYETFEPRFWKKAAGSEKSTIDWFTQLFDDDKSVSVVASNEANILGFLIARDIPVPPVYEPGGPTALIDDFCVAEGKWGDVGTQILRFARRELRARGFVQIVVVGATRDDEKTAFLKSTDLSLASTWWTAGT